MPKPLYLIERASELHSMYFDKHMTTREIGKALGVSKHPVEDAMKHLGYSLRPKGRRTPGTKPTRAFLEQAIFVEHRSILDICRELKVDSGAIKWWMNEYGLPAYKFDAWTQRNAQRGVVVPSKDDIQAMYSAGDSMNYIAGQIGVSQQMVRNWLRDYDIVARQSGWNAVRHACTDGHSVRSLYEQRVDNWLFEHDLEHVYEPRVPDSRFRADFLCQHHYIEIFGVTHADWYKRRRQLKTALYKTLGLALITLNLSDFDTFRNGLWHRKLSVLLD